jgi:membrane-bound serine protease (ClpP class)
MFRTFKTHGLALLVLVIGLIVASSALSQPASSGGLVVVMKMDDPIMPPTKDYFERALRRAEREGATCVLVEMDTPGGEFNTIRQTS